MQSGRNTTGYSNPLQALANFEIGTTSGSSLRAGEKITQTIYYNGNVVSQDQDYDLQALANLDTTIPGTYKVVYSVSRREGSGYTRGNDVELTITVKPEIASVNAFNVDLKQIIVAAFISSGIILAAAYVYMASKKMKVD